MATTLIGYLLSRKLNRELTVDIYFMDKGALIIGCADKSKCKFEWSSRGHSFLSAKEKLSDDRRSSRHAWPTLQVSQQLEPPVEERCTAVLRPQESLRM